MEIRVSPGLRVAPANEIVDLLTCPVPVKTRNPVVAWRLVCGFRIILGNSAALFPLRSV